MPFSNIRSLPYFPDSELLMRALQELGMPAFLDSANHGGCNGSRDILMAAPVAYLKVENGALSCSDNAVEFVGKSTAILDFLNNIRAMKERFLPTIEKRGNADLQLEHAGSVAGYLGYPKLSGKSNLLIDDAFVGVYLWTLVLDHDAKTCELRIHPGCSSDTLRSASESIEESLAREVKAEAPAFELISAMTEGSSYADYRQAFDEIKSRIERGDCYQVNLTQEFSAKVQGSPLAAYIALRRATNAPFSAYMDWNGGALLSLSPERFLRLQDGSVLTQPIKGTRPRGQSRAEDERFAQDLLTSNKDRAENLMIVDLLRNDLGRVCDVGSIEATQLFDLQSYNNVHHMVSNVRGRLQGGKDALDLLASCYPGGSITGAPKLKAMEIIQQLEHHSRRVYCGTVFHLGPNGDFDSSITIRSLLWQSGTLSCWAGGGIVADSECGLEYQECFDKINNIFNVLKGKS